VIAIRRNFILVLMVVSFGYTFVKILPIDGQVYHTHRPERKRELDYVVLKPGTAIFITASCSNAMRTAPGRTIDRVALVWNSGTDIPWDIIYAEYRYATPPLWLREGIYSS
jgi:hypothetical protein